MQIIRRLTIFCSKLNDENLMAMKSYMKALLTVELVLDCTSYSAVHKACGVTNKILAVLR